MAAQGENLMKRTICSVLAVCCVCLAAVARLQAAPAQGSISGVVFNDLNGNGVQDAGEPGLTGWTVTATESVDLTTTTDSTGHFQITNVSSGTWTVRVVSPAGWVQTTPDPPGISVGTSGDSPAGSFGFAQLSEIPALGVWGLGVLILALAIIGAALLKRAT
jgi:SdrD B-like domain